MLNLHFLMVGQVELWTICNKKTENNRLNHKMEGEE